MIFASQVIDTPVFTRGDSFERFDGYVKEIFSKIVGGDNEAGEDDNTADEPQNN